MIIVRGVYQAKYGKGDDLVQLFKEGNDLFPGMNMSRIMTDLSGQFFTVVTEAEYTSFSAWEADAQKIFGDKRFAAWFERMVPIVDGGRREFYTLVE